MGSRDVDPFGSLNRVLDSRHTQPGAIRKACLAVEDCVVNNRDNLRGFFDKCFPNLLKRVFGYDDFEASWLNMVTKPGKEEDAKALVSLLHPQGKLFASMHRADSESLIRFIFPVERLPGHTQALLASMKGRKELEQWPQYHNHILGPEQNAARRTQVFLDVFTYFMFWTAFYVLRGNRSEEVGRGTLPGGSGSSYLPSPSGGTPYPSHQPWGLSELRRLGSSFLPGLGQPGGAPLYRHPYYTLLRLYLEHFLPRPGPDGEADKARAAGGGGRGEGGAAGAAGGEGARGCGRVLLNVLMEFWLTDAAEPVAVDSEPGAAGAAGGREKGAAGGAALGLPGRTLSYQPPSEDRVEALILLVRYIAVVEPSTRPGAGRGAQLAARPGALGGGAAACGVQQQGQGQGAGPGAGSAGSVHAGPAAVERIPAQGKQAWLAEVSVRTSPPSPSPRLLAPFPPGSLLAGPSAGPAVQAVSRKLYRFLRHTLTHWPLPSSASLTPIITLWLSVLTPWAPRPTPPSTANHHTPLYGLPSPNKRHPDPSSRLTSYGSTGVQQYSNPFARHNAGAGPSGGPGRPAPASAPAGGGYTPAWRQHVLSHLPFYTILIPRFLELTYARQSFRSDAAMSDLLLLLQPLAACPALVAELRAAEAAVQAYLAAPLRRAEGQYKELVGWAVEQAADWEGAAVAGVQQGGGGAMQADPSYSLFSSDSRGAVSYALAILKASEAQLVRPELRSAVWEAASTVLPLQGAEAELMHGELVPPGPLGPVADLRFPRAGHWMGVQYHGDWLKRPIASNEVGPLVRCLVALSEALNVWLGLSGPLSPEEEEEAVETLGQQGLRWLRRRGYRVNLRFLAEKQVLAWLFVLYVLYRLFCGTGGTPLLGPPVEVVVPELDPAAMLLPPLE